VGSVLCQTSGPTLAKGGTAMSVEVYQWVTVILLVAILLALVIRRI